jgi:hypothetical protein
LLSETVAQLVGTEMKVKRDRPIESQQPRKHRKSKCFLIFNFFAAKNRRGDFGQQSNAHCKDSQTKIRKCWSRVMAGHQARSAVFAHNVPAIHVFCFTAK